MSDKHLLMGYPSIGKNALTISFSNLDNPVRKNLVVDHMDYEFLGSFEFDLTQP
jgi:hypothetical protein